MFKQVFISYNSYVKFQMTTFFRNFYIRTPYVSFTRNAPATSLLFLGLWLNCLLPIKFSCGRRKRDVANNSV